MIKIDLKERKEISLKILIELDNICKKHNIPYFLAYGTLIGAVRHRGFIPWDDDIDVWIPSSHFDQLLVILENESSYKVINHHKDENWIRPFSKLSNDKTIIVDNDKESINCLQTERGIAIDLFPLYPVKNHRILARKLYFYHSLIVDSFLQKHTNKTNVISNILTFFLGGVNTIKGKIIETEQNKIAAKKVGCLLTPYGNKDFHDIDDFDIIKLEFCGKKFNAPSGYDRILSRIYGDYMELPPENMRVSNHDSIALWK